MKRYISGLVACIAIVAMGCSSSKSGNGVPPGSTPVVGNPPTSKEPVANGDFKSIVGVWATAEPVELPMEKGGGKMMLTLEFAANGKVKSTESVNGKDLGGEATYKLQGNKLTIIGKKDDMDFSHVLTIRKITDTELVFSDGKKAEDMTLIKKKASTSVPKGKDEFKSIVGVWTMPEPKEIPKEKGGGKILITLEFTADGKVKHTMSLNGKDRVEESKYVQQGNKITIMAKKDGMDISDELTIRKLTDTELIISDARKDEDTTFIKKK